MTACVDQVRRAMVQDARHHAAPIGTQMPLRLRHAEIADQIGGEQEPVARETAEQVEIEQKLAEQVAVDQATIDAIEHDGAADTPSEQESPSS